MYGTCIVTRDIQALLTSFHNRQVCDTAIPELARFRSPDFTMLSRRAIAQLASPLRRAVSSSRTVTNDSSTAVDKQDPSVPKQAPNYPTTWTASQRLRPGLGSTPRFEQ